MCVGLLNKETGGIVASVIKTVTSILCGDLLSVHCLALQQGRRRAESEMGLGERSRNGQSPSRGGSHPETKQGRIKERGFKTHQNRTKVYFRWQEHPSRHNSGRIVVFTTPGWCVRYLSSQPPRCPLGPRASLFVEDMAAFFQSPKEPPTAERGPHPFPLSTSNACACGRSPGPQRKGPYFDRG